MLNPEGADLWFGPTHQPVGFTSGVLAQFDGSAEPVVRELIQNSLDAAQQAGRKAEVRFEICEIPKLSLPGWHTYAKALKRAKEERRRWNKGKPSHDEKMVVQRIEQARDSSQMLPLLLCIDNGHGLNGSRMDALLTPGNTSKGQHGAGSFGLGHHAAFGASNLRYVLYASNYRNPQDEMTQIASGHAILASHRDSDGQLCAADGYWFNTGQTSLAFDGSHGNYPTEPPDLLARYLESLDDTGTVVCIAGFNDFHRDEDDPSSLTSICRVAAANFSDAIHSAGMTMTVRDERYVSAEEYVVTGSTLRTLLEPTSTRMHAQRQGQISGSIAHAAACTLESGQKIEGPAGSTIRWRPLVGHNRPVTQVHVFRKGMWITSRAPRLTKKDFSKVWHFDAVLSLDSGTLEQLVRNAEGPEHRGLDTRRLDYGQKRQLRELLAEVAQRLREHVGERDDLNEYTPDGFATLLGQLNRTAEPVRRPRPPGGGGQRTGPIAGGGTGNGGGGKTPTRTEGVPRGGSVPSYRSSLRLTAGTYEVEALVRYEEDDSPKSQVGVRVRSASGSDGSCEAPLRDQFLRIKQINDAEDNRRAWAHDANGELELVVPVRKGTQRLKIQLAEPVSDPGTVELDLVRRQPSANSDKADKSQAENDEDLSIGETTAALLTKGQRTELVG